MDGACWTDTAVDTVRAPDGSLLGLAVGYVLAGPGLAVYALAADVGPVEGVWEGEDGCCFGVSAGDWSCGCVLHDGGGERTYW